MPKSTEQKGANALTADVPQKTGIWLWSPAIQGVHIGLTSGHTMFIPHDEDGVEVPKIFRREAIARGCLPVGVSEDDVDTPKVDRAVLIRTAMEKMVKGDDEGSFTQDAKPALPKLNAMVGFSVERSERDAIWAQLEADIAAGTVD